VQVDMKNALAGGGIAIHYDAVSVIRKTLIGGNPGGSNKQFTDKRFVPVLEVIHGRDMATWYQQYVRRRFWIDIPERDKRVVLINNIRGQITVNNPAEKTVIFTHKPPLFDQAASVKRV
jgi:hypothetical protein